MKAPTDRKKPKPTPPKVHGHGQVRITFGGLASGDVHPPITAWAVARVNLQSRGSGTVKPPPPATTARRKE